MSLLELRWDLRYDITLINYTIDGSEIRQTTESMHKTRTINSGSWFILGKE